MLIRLGKYDYLLAGSGVVVDFSKFLGSRLGLLSVDEVTIDHQGQMQYLRRHNGDQSHQGRHARISVGDWKILHIQLYEYK